MQYRAASVGDTEAIAVLHAQSWQRNYRGMMPDAFLDGPVVEERLSAWRARLDDRGTDRQILLAVDGEQLAGFICVFAAEDEAWGSYIDNLHVSADFQSRRVGTRLMAHAAEWLAREFGEAGVYLWVMEANTAARRFYERLGARNVETILKSDPGGGRAPNCRYVWESPAALLRAAGRHPLAERDSTAERNKALIRRWIAAADAGFQTDFGVFFSRAYRGHLNGRIHMDVSELERLERSFAAAFSNAVRTVEDLLATDDRVVLRLRTLVQHTAEWQGIPATGRRVEFTAMVIYRIVGERIVESWGEVDFAGLWRQLSA